MTSIEFDIEDIVSDMLTHLSSVLADARSGLSSEDVVHLRLFHRASDSPRDSFPAIDDGMDLRSKLASAVSLWCKDCRSPPTTSVIPVFGIDVLNDESECAEGSIFLALQVLLLDAIHTETEVWLRKDREYNM